MSGWRPLSEAPCPTEGGEPIKYIVWDHLLSDIAIAYLDVHGFWSGDVFNHKRYRPRLYLAVSLEPSPEELAGARLS